jgi:hypothetical protein
MNDDRRVYDLDGKKIGSIPGTEVVAADGEQNALSLNVSDFEEVGIAGAGVGD